MSNAFPVNGGPPFHYPKLVELQNAQDEKSGVKKDLWCDSTMNYPGKTYGMGDNCSFSGTAEGGPLMGGRVAVFGVSADAPYVGSPWFGGPADDYYTHTHTVSMPDAAGAYLTNADGVTYADAGMALPMDANGFLCYAGVVKLPGERHCMANRATVPWGFSDQFYVPCQGTGTIATSGQLIAYAETDLGIKDQLYFRTKITDTSAGSTQLLGGFLNHDDGGAAQLFICGGVFRPGCAGAGFVLDLDMKAPALMAAAKAAL